MREKSADAKHPHSKHKIFQKLKSNNHLTYIIFKFNINYMKKIYAPNNTGSSYLIIIIASVAVLVLALGGYFLFFNKSGSNPLTRLTNKCTSSEKACELIENINKYRESKKLSPVRFDGEVCAKIQNFTNDMKEIYSDNSVKLNNDSVKENLDRLRNDSKYESLIGDYTLSDKEIDNDRRIRYFIRIIETNNLETDVKKYSDSYQELFAGDYNTACITTSSKEIKGDYDFASFYFVNFKN